MQQTQSQGETEEKRTIDQKNRKQNEKILIR